MKKSSLSCTHAAPVCSLMLEGSRVPAAKRVGLRTATHALKGIAIVVNTKGERLVVILAACCTDVSFRLNEKSNDVKVAILGTLV